MQIKNHTFIITGAASGLGRATAELLISKGGRVCLWDLNAEVGARVVSELQKKTGAPEDSLLFTCVDVTSEASLLAAMQVLTASQCLPERLGGLVNCAGVAPGERVLGKEGPHVLAHFQRAIDINLVGTFNVLRLVADYMSRQTPNEEGERGVIINTASVAAYEGQIGQAAYSASKAGVVGMTLPVARELARFGIRVMTIAPGIFDTPMMQAMSDAVRGSLATQIPFPSRFGKASEYAKLVEHILINAYLNGETIRLDAAVRMGVK